MSAIPKVIQKAARSAGPAQFNLDALERVGCAMYENGYTADELVEAVQKCVPEDEQACRKERELISQSHTLLLAGLAGVTLLFPLFRAFRVLRATAVGLLDAFRHVLPSALLTRLGFSGGASGATVTTFEAAAEGLTPEYLTAVSKSADILARLRLAATASTTTQVLLGVAGLTATVSNFIFGAPDGEQTNDGA